MSEWRFTAYDLRSGAKLTDLNVQSWESTDELPVGETPRSGSWLATVELDGATSGTKNVVANMPLLADGIPLLDDDTGAPLMTGPEPYGFATSRRTTVRDSTRRGRTLVVAERDGVPLFSGIVWRRRYNAADRLLTLAGSGLFGYFTHHVPQTPQWSYSAQDQFAIVRDLVQRVQSTPGCDIGMQVTPGNSGVLRDDTYRRFDNLTYGELIHNRSAMLNGFDYACRVEYHGDSIQRWLRLYYPRRGRTFAATNLVFRAPGNAVLFDVDEDGTDMAVQVFGFGAGDGPDMLIRSGSRLDLVDAGWPGYTTNRSWKDVTVPATLTSHAQATADRLSGVDDEAFVVQVDPTFKGQPWGSWDLGDDCALVVADDPYFPAEDDGSPGLWLQRRVGAHRWRYSSDGEELSVRLERRVT